MLGAGGDGAWGNNCAPSWDVQPSGKRSVRTG